MKYEIIFADNSSERRITPYFPFLTFSFGGCRTVLSFRKDKTGVEVGIKDQGGIETLALLVLESLQDTRLSLCQQFPDFIVGKHPVGFQPEYGQAAFRVVASYHLAEELHSARSALGTRAAGILFPNSFSHDSSSEVMDVAYSSISLRNFPAGTSPRSMHASSFSHSPVMATSAMRMVLTME